MNKNRESEICSAIKDLIDDSDSQVTPIKNRWRDNYDMFVYGTQSPDKEDWQTNFSVNKLNTSVRTAQGRLVNILVNNPDWYELCPRGYSDEAEKLAPAFKKMLDYYLESAKFKRHAGTFFLCSLISAGNIYIGWKPRLVQNPEYVLDKTEKERQRIQRRLAKNVENPQVEEDMTGQDLEEKLLQALDEFQAESQGLPATKPTPRPYIQIGCLDLRDINHERIFWDPNVMYMEDSAWKAFKLEVNRWELNHLAKLGIYSKSKVKKIGSNKDLGVRLGNQNLRYKNIINKHRTQSDMVELTFYFGPLIINNEIEKDTYFAIIANDKTILAEGEYPYWEPPGYHTPVITAAVRQIPYRATGAGIGDNATQIQRIYDSNWQLVCDSFRNGISGINVVNYQNLVDKGQLLEGIYPGMTLEVRGNPKDNFQHIDLTSNIENQAHPVQNMLEQAIDSLTGVNELQTGGSNPFSRTSAAETTARLDAGNQNVNIIALDLEQNFLVPALEQAFARVLQYGLPEISSNPELSKLLTEEELYELQRYTAGNRLEILNQWYSFKIKGFSQQGDRNEQAMRDNELLQIANSGGPLSQLLNLPEFMRRYFRNRDIKDPDKLLIINNSPLQQVTAENQLLLSGHMVMPAETDDHEFHIQNQQALAQSPYATPQIQQHVQYHMMMLQQMQMMQAQAQEQNPGSNEGQMQ